MQTINLNDYYLTSSGTIAIIDTQTEEVIKLIEIEEFGTAISIED